MSAGSSRYASNQAHQRDSRTQLFANVTPYNPSGNSSRASTPSFRAATPNSKGQYSDSVLSQLESQSDDQLESLFPKVKMLKDITSKIGEEVRDSSKLLNSMEDNFDSARLRLKGTFNRMMRMAERSGVGWRVWLGLFLFITFLFLYVKWR